MVGRTYMRVMDQKVIIILAIFILEASNKDQALLMDIRKKDMINNITIIMAFMMLEPLDWRPVLPRFGFKRKESAVDRVGCRKSNSTMWIE